MNSFTFFEKPTHTTKTTTKIKPEIFNLHAKNFNIFVTD